MAINDVSSGQVLKFLHEATGTFSEYRQSICLKYNWTGGDVVNLNGTTHVDKGSGQPKGYDAWCDQVNGYTEYYVGLLHKDLSVVDPYPLFDRDTKHVKQVPRAHFENGRVAFKNICFDISSGKARQLSEYSEKQKRCFFLVIIGVSGASASVVAEIGPCEIVTRADEFPEEVQVILDKRKNTKGKFVKATTARKRSAAKEHASSNSEYHLEPQPKRRCRRPTRPAATGPTSKYSGWRSPQTVVGTDSEGSAPSPRDSDCDSDSAHRPPPITAQSASSPEGAGFAGEWPPAFPTFSEHHVFCPHTPLSPHSATVAHLDQADPKAHAANPLPDLFDYDAYAASVLDQANPEAHAANPLPDLFDFDAYEASVLDASPAELGSPLTLEEFLHKVYPS